MEFSGVEILTLILTNTAFLAVLGWFAKSIMQHVLSRDIEKFKLELKAESDRNMESYKHSFEVERTRLQISFSEIFSDQAKIIMELYKRILELEGYLNGCLDIQTQRQEFQSKLGELKEFYHLKRILIPEKLDAYVYEAVNQGFVVWGESCNEDRSDISEKSFREVKEQCLREIRLLLSVNIQN